MPSDVISEFADQKKIYVTDPDANQGAGQVSLMPASVIANKIKAELLAGMRFYTYEATAQINASNLIGRCEVAINVPGLAVNDRVIGCEPTASLPGNLSYGYAFVSAANTLTVAFSTPISFTGEVSIPLRLLVMR